MSSSTDTKQGSSSQQHWLSHLAQHRRESAYALFAATVVFVIITAWVGYKYRTDYIAVSLWAGAVALICQVAGLWRYQGDSHDLAPEDAARLLVLGLGGLIGFVTVVILGFGLTWQWRAILMGGWEAWQGKEGWRIWICALSVVVGLMLMFVSLQLAQTRQHTSAGFRRLLYGYNAALGGFLLLLILGVLNVLVYIPWGPFKWFNTTYYWANASIYSLSSQSENVLQGLQKPVHVYVILEQRSIWYHPMHALLDNFRDVNSRIQVTYLSPDINKEEVEKLVKEYRFGGDRGERRGVLLVYGKEADAETRFVKFQDLFSDLSDPGVPNKQPLFKGEIALMGELNALSEGKEKPIIYFTQGHGELDLGDAGPPKALNTGLGILKTRLEGNNYTVRGLQFTTVAGVKSKNPDIVIAKRVPEDATAVVIAGPKTEFSKEAIDALQTFMEPTDPKAKKGKLIALLEPVVGPNKTVQLTGIEAFVAQFGVQVNNDRILRVDMSGRVVNPEWVLTMMNTDQPASLGNPVIAAFAGSSFTFHDRTRTVQPRTEGQQPNTKYKPEILMVAPGLPAQQLWAEKNLSADPTELIFEYDRRNELGQKFANDPLPVAVAVTEMEGSGPHAFMQSESKPRLVVFGNSAMISNVHVTEQQARTPYYSLFVSTLSWLRERPNNIGIEPKKRDYYLPNPAMDTWRLVLVPGLLMVTAIVGLGMGVWVVRRR